MEGLFKEAIKYEKKLVISKITWNDIFLKNKYKFFLKKRVEEGKALCQWRLQKTLSIGTKKHFNYSYWRACTIYNKATIKLSKAFSKLLKVLLFLSSQSFQKINFLTDWNQRNLFSLLFEGKTNQGIFKKASKSFQKRKVLTDWNQRMTRSNKNTKVFLRSYMWNKFRKLFYIVFR